MEWTKVLGSVWARELISHVWCESVIVPIHKKGSRFPSENDTNSCGKDCIETALRHYIFHRFSSTRGSRTCENEAGSRPGRIWIAHIFPLRRILEHGDVFHRPRFSVFLDLQLAFESVNRAILWRRPPLEDVPGKFISLSHSLHANNQSRVRASDDVSLWFTTRGGIRLGSTLTPFILKGAIEVFVQVALSGICLI